MCLLVLHRHPQVPLSNTSLHSSHSVFKSCLVYLQSASHILTSSAPKLCFSLIGRTESSLHLTFLSSPKGLFSMQQMEASFCKNPFSSCQFLMKTVQLFQFSLDQHPVFPVGYCTYHGLVLPLSALLFHSYSTSNNTILLAFP